MPLFSPAFHALLPCEKSTDCPADCNPNKKQTGKFSCHISWNTLLSGNRSFAFWTKYLQPVLSCSAFTCTLFSSSDSHLSEYFQTAFHALRSDLFGYEFTVREQLSHIILELFLRFEDQINLPRQAMRTDTLRLEQMLEYIHTHYREPFTLSDISGTFDYPSYFSKQFKRFYKCTPKEYRASSQD